MGGRYIRAVKSRTKRLLIPNFFSGFNSEADDSVLSVSTAKNIYNFDFSSGALCTGYGIDGGRIKRQKLNSVWEYTRFDYDNNEKIVTLMYSDRDGNVYYLDQNNQENQLILPKFNASVYAVNYRLYGEDVILMCSKKDNMAVWNGVSQPYVVTDSPLISSMTMHFERMFATIGGESNAVWFSDDLDPTNWEPSLDKGGFVQMIDERGDSNKVISFLNYVYIFRDYGISRLTAYAEQADFSLTNLFVSSGRIYPDSVALCGDCVLFLAVDGVYKFDGLSTRKILPNICGLLQPSPDCNAAYYNGKYYLSLKMSGGIDLNSNSAMLVYDLKSGDYSISKDFSVRRLTATSDGLYAVLSDGTCGLIKKNGGIFAAPLDKSWESGFIDFGVDSVKIIKEIYFDTDTEFKLHVKSERSEKVFDVLPSSGMTKVIVNVSGRKLSLKITARCKEARISRPIIKIAVVE